MDPHAINYVDFDRMDVAKLRNPSKLVVVHSIWSRISSSVAHALGWLRYQNNIEHEGDDLSGDEWPDVNIMKEKDRGYESETSGWLTHTDEEMDTHDEAPSPPHPEKPRKRKSGRGGRNGPSKRAKE